MGISVFLSYPKPFNDDQQCFINDLSKALEKRGLEPRTLGVTDYDVEAPLNAIRRMMLESNGIITVAFRRSIIENGKFKPESADQNVLNNVWLTSPYSHIEPAMAFQIGLPILLLREKGVYADGILERGVVGMYMPEFDLGDATEDYLTSNEWQQIFPIWESKVRSVVDHKGRPPKLYK